MNALAELFPAEDHRFHLTLRRGEPREFFSAQDKTGGILAERRRWLAGDPGRYAAMGPEAEPLLAEFVELAAGWGDRPVAGAQGTMRLGAVGGAFEPDLLFLSADATGAVRLRGGVLVFPTGWALTEKLGQTLETIHGVVPGLNAALGSPIQQFLGRLKPGLAYLRDNWGLTATPELNLHPSRAIPPPVPPVSLDRLWLRVEHQALLALPRSGGIVFGIRIALHRLDVVAQDRVAAAGLRRALATMPDDLAVYKRLEQVRDQLVALI
ncbi:MAG: DUF3445 domain-containing protein [Verrucomicrobia bacterium]|nr:DUF3445 domain-containing protein [Verrucomicrobiota bacterium]